MKLEKSSSCCWMHLPEVTPEQLSPRVISASYWSWPQSLDTGLWEMSRGMSMILIVEGGVRYQAWDEHGGQLVGTAQAGQMLTLFSGRMRYAGLPDCRVHFYQTNIIPAPGKLAQGVPVLPEYGRLPHLANIGLAVPRVTALFERMIEALYASPPGWQLDTSAAALELLLITLLASGPSMPTPVRHFDTWEKLLARLDADPDPPSVRDLADECGLSTNHFIRMFRAYTGTTPKKYLLTRKLIKAHAMLIEGSAVNDVARRCGFTDPYYFSRVFKQYLGVPPSRSAELALDASALKPHMPINRHIRAAGTAECARYLGAAPRGE